MIVYLLLNNVNQKAYIGQHYGFTLAKRWNRQLSNAKVNGHLSNAIQKYGPASFSTKILCHASCQQELDLLEQFFIAAYKSTNPRHGYNQQSGGRKWRGQYTKELRQVISEATRKACGDDMDLSEVHTSFLSVRMAGLHSIPSIPCSMVWCIRAGCATSVR
jgi:group I intron endonuclease